MTNRQVNRSNFAFRSYAFLTDLWSFLRSKPQRAWTEPPTEKPHLHAMPVDPGSVELFPFLGHQWIGANIHLGLSGFSCEHLPNPCSMLTYSWWVRNPATVEVGRIFPHYLLGFSTIPGGYLDLWTINSMLTFLVDIKNVSFPSKQRNSMSCFGSENFGKLTSGIPTDPERAAGLPGPQVPP